MECIWRIWVGVACSFLWCYELWCFCTEFSHVDTATEWTFIQAFFLCNYNTQPKVFWLVLIVLCITSLSPNFLAKKPSKWNSLDLGQTEVFVHRRLTLFTNNTPMIGRPSWVHALIPCCNIASQFQPQTRTCPEFSNSWKLVRHEEIKLNEVTRCGKCWNLWPGQVSLGDMDDETVCQDTSTRQLPSYSIYTNSSIN